MKKGKKKLLLWSDINDHPIFYQDYKKCSRHNAAFNNPISINTNHFSFIDLTELS